MYCRIVKSTLAFIKTKIERFLLMILKSPVTFQMLGRPTTKHAKNDYERIQYLR
jgi:hypothetical protein